MIYSFTCAAYLVASSDLQDRKQFVQIGNMKSQAGDGLLEKSNLLEMTCGVPHGSILSSSLFLIYISEIANSYNKLSFRVFAS